ncbi:MAG: acyl carrier protein [Gammaproteobacteria bacterium]
MATIDEVKMVLGDALQLGERAQRLEANTRLLGNLPELDSMAVVTVLTGIEEHFGFIINDDEISADTFATLASLSEFVGQKLRS